ncbi:hypothetical protein [Natrarchaeobaculum aegyptiacum]|uniref:Uncharacterized protein n=1 Tax=Natrarchaeobaculum aegyptiacum TaxID=745377 RepID=A0A2Z2HU98_9EURY|nr:hypothetical protein [Natrarchaeobaculum aegyptiacum]ARS89067.1 hypothetical protein B1756_04380 [Natrarchaeobaculum aegyptiacum]
MSKNATGADRFAVADLPIDDIDSGESILLTGADADALRGVFNRLVAADDGERSVVLATNSDGMTVQRNIDAVRREAGARTLVLASNGPARGDEIETVDDIGDLTTLGMQFSNLVAASQQVHPRFRSGIFLCSTITAAVDDTRSVYRFLNTNFLTELRRGDGIGVCAIDTSADLETDVDSMITGLETSFTGRIDVERTGPNDLVLTVTGLSSREQTLEVSL